jgi:mannose-6-phosphate isomerase-like protein (cupin superfamily)
MPAATDVSIIRFADLEPAWHVPGAKVPGTMRWLISWVGGPKGYINSNPGFAVENDEISVGLMYLPVAQRQQGLHYHTITEIYVIIKGCVEGYDGSGHPHRAGPMDCIYIPRGVPHGVRNIGTEDVELVWLHDGVEAKGLTVYCQTQEDIDTAPSREPIRVVTLAGLAPFWNAPRAKEPEFLRYIVSWIGGPPGFENFNRGVAVETDKIALGLTVILPGHKQVHHRHDVAEVYVILKGKAVVQHNNERKELGYLDSMYFPAKTIHALRNHGSDPVYVMWTHEKSNLINGTQYQDK